jgi:aminopeptidase N
LQLWQKQKKKYLPLFEKGWSCFQCCKRKFFRAILVIDPSKANSLADKIDLDGASDELQAQLLPIIVKNKVTSQMPKIAPLAAFYPFIKFQNPE